MHYLLFYELATTTFPGAQVPQRAPGNGLEGYRTRRTVLGGALANPVDGVVMLFKGDSPEVAEGFARADPYVTHGIVKRWYVREWTTVAGEGSVNPVRPAGASIAG